MANLPVESLKTGGLWWFTDLTACDPFYILPIVTSATLLLTFEVLQFSLITVNIKFFNL